MKELRQKLGGPGVSDDDLLLRYFTGKDEVAAMRAAGAPKEYVSARHPLVTLIGELTEQADYHQVYVRKGDLLVHLEKKESSTRERMIP